MYWLWHLRQIASFNCCLFVLIRLGNEVFMNLQTKPPKHCWSCTSSLCWHIHLHVPVYRVSSLLPILDSLFHKCLFIIFINYYYLLSIIYTPCCNSGCLYLMALCMLVFKYLILSNWLHVPKLDYANVIVQSIIRIIFRIL